MIMKNIVSSLFVLLLLSGCDNRAEPIEDETQVVPQEHMDEKEMPPLKQYERGRIETHSTE